MTSVVCHSGVFDCVPGVLSEIALSYFYGGCICPSVVIWIASMQVTMAGAVMSTVSRMCSRAVPSFLNLPDGALSLTLCDFYVPGDVSPVFPKEVFCGAIHDDTSILIAFMISDVKAVSCDMSQLLILETSVFIVGHHVDC